MRTLIHELPYEQPIASGRYVYMREGRATGAVETWRLTAAREEYRFLRVDLDASAASGDNALYHLTLDAAARPQRLKFEFFRQGARIRGDLLFEEEDALLTRLVAGQRLESHAAYTTGMPFWFPASAGLGLLAGLAANVPAVPALTLDRAQAFALWPTMLAVEQSPAQQLTLMGREIDVAVRTVRWQDQARVLWLDENNWPVRVQRGDLIATDKRYVRYTRG